MYIYIYMYVCMHQCGYVFQHVFVSSFSLSPSLNLSVPLLLYFVGRMGNVLSIAGEAEATMSTTLCKCVGHLIQRTEIERLLRSAMAIAIADPRNRPFFTRAGVLYFVRRPSDTFKFLRHVIRAILSARPKCSHRCVSQKETPLKCVEILTHSTRRSTEQTSMRAKWFKHIAI